MSFITSFSKRYNGKSFNERYDFIPKIAETLGVEIMTIEDLVIFYASQDEFKNWALTQLNNAPTQTRSMEILKQQIKTLGILGHAVKLLGEAGTACVKARHNKLTQQDKKHINQIASHIDNPNWFMKKQFGSKSTLSQINDWSDVCQYYSDAWVNPENYGFERPSSARDFLSDNNFKQLLRAYLNIKFVGICKRKNGGIGSGVADSYIHGIVEEGLNDIQYDEKDTMVIVTVSDKYPYNLVSFIAAEKGENNDVHGELICTAEGGPSGVGKLQMSATLLMAKEANINFCFIQAVQGLFGVQGTLYSRFGFEFNFPPKLLKRKSALEQHMFNPLESFPVVNKLDVWKQKYTANKSWINWIASIPSRTMASFMLVPMWIYIPSVNAKCMYNINTIKGWDCREGPYQGEGGKGGKGDTRSWKGMMERISGYEPSRQQDVYQHMSVGMEE